MVERISNFHGCPLFFPFPQTTRIRIHHFSQVEGCSLSRVPFGGENRKEVLMRVLGIEFTSSEMNYVAIDETPEGFNLHSASRLSLGSTRSREALIAFQDAVKALFNSTAPALIAIKEKPESGRLRAGAAALKMEGIALASAPCDVVFVSGARVNRSGASDDSLFSYLQPALKTAAPALAGYGR